MATNGTATDTAVTAAAPTSLAGWAAFQRAVNVTLPNQLNQAQTLLSAAGAILSRG